MKQQKPPPSRDDIFDAILRNGDDASSERLAHWAALYPEFRDDILNLADDAPPVSDAAADAQFQQLEATALARASASVRRRDRPAMLRELIDEAGLDLPEVALRTHFRRGMLSDVEQGAIRPPLGPNLVDALSRALRRAPQLIERALEAAAANPAPMHAKATGEVTIRQVSWREFIEDSDMSDQEKAYWLDGA